MLFGSRFSIFPMVAFLCLTSTVSAEMNHSMSSDDSHLALPAPKTNGVDAATLEIRKNKIEEIYNKLIYPFPKAILANPKLVDHIFDSKNIRGRVTPAGAYYDMEAVIEYFYAFAYTGITRVDAVKINKIVAAGDIVAVDVDLHFCGIPYIACDPSIAKDMFNTTLRQTGFYTFNDDNKVVSFDLTIPNLGEAHNVASEFKRNMAIEGVCMNLTTSHLNIVTDEIKLEGTCTKYFDGPEDFAEGFPVTDSPRKNCIRFMNSIPYGTWDQPKSNTFVCRMLHSLLTPVREMHCAHTSYDGGGKCVDQEYSQFFEKAY